METNSKTVDIAEGIPLLITEREEEAFPGLVQETQNKR